jgi:zinc finger BED domain-containing protein 1 (E3 SUMO-protein ligase ZBED1)
MITPDNSVEIAVAAPASTPVALRNAEVFIPPNCTAEVWKYFGKYSSLIPLKDHVVVCKLCRDAQHVDEVDAAKWEVKYEDSKSTSKLQNHLHSKHKQVAIQLAVDKSNADVAKRNSGQQQQTLDHVIFRNKAENQREKYLRWVVESHKPLGECDNPYFRAYLETFDPKVKHEERHSVTRRLEVKAQEIREGVKVMIANQKIAFTTDCWTSMANESFIALTAHYIDNWELYSLVVECDPFPGTHKVENLVVKVDSMMVACNIMKENVVAAVTDTEPTMTAFGRQIGYPWLGCFDHILELITGIPFESEGAKAVLKIAREVVGQFSSSTQATEKLLHIQPIVQPTTTPVTVMQDVATRWWSTWLMIQRLLHLKPSINSLRISNSIRIAPSGSDWELLEILEALLRPFMECQRFMEGDSYVTISFLPFFVSKLRIILGDMEESYSPGHMSACSEPIRAAVYLCVQDMKAKFEERWGTGIPGTVFDEHKTEGVRRIQKGLPLVAMLAAALDPRTKSLKGIPEEDKIKVITALKAEMLRVYDLLHRRPQDEDDVYSTTSDDGFELSDRWRPRGNSVTELEDELFGDLNDDAHAYVTDLSYEDQRERVVSAELDAFNMAPSLKHTKQQPGDPLPWYKRHALVYPLHAALAIQYLCIPGTSASSERVFSNGGNTVTEKRSRLTGDHVSDLIVLKGCWGKVESSIKKRKIVELE